MRLEAARAYIEQTAEGIDGPGDELLNTEGAIAKYLATEAGNAAADAAIQAHGGYGYTKEYMVEKIKRDVRITTIYEGTSEIMEMTIGRDRWQHHLKTRGAHYHNIGRELEGRHREHPYAGFDTAALAAHSFAEVLEQARSKRLTRNQHLLFRIGELAAYVEGAAAFCERAAGAKMGTLNPKTPNRFDAPTTAAMSRVFAREAAQRVAIDGMRWIVGAQDNGGADVASLEQSAQLSKVYAAQVGLLEDMNKIGDAIYERS